MLLLFCHGNKPMIISFFLCIFLALRKREPSLHINLCLPSYLMKGRLLEVPLMGRTLLVCSLSSQKWECFILGMGCGPKFCLHFYDLVWKDWFRTMVQLQHVKLGQLLWTTQGQVFLHKVGSVGKCSYIEGSGVVGWTGPPLSGITESSESLDWTDLGSDLFTSCKMLNFGYLNFLSFSFQL